MKTINLKSALKVFLFSLLLCSANAFATTKLPTEASSNGHESKTCFVKKPAKMSKATSKAYPKTSKGFAMQSSKSKKFFKK
ncbi:hypothetical protein [Flavobacterium terrisoli]|uniref:hypothetical protein n=1 Tax=Flavobacterium terrisoli TaxID=3242195 RepID=UPI002543A12B|nr:hypothetical protein [Flavobacterium buctense]